MVFGVSDIPDLSGRVAVVTGANGGLGLQTATVLAAKGAHVVLAARDERKTARVIDAITRATPGAQLTAVTSIWPDLRRSARLLRRSSGMRPAWTCWSTTPG